MKVLVDTSVWSLVLRRTGRAQHQSTASELASLVVDGRVAMIGPVRQELLSGIKERSHYERLRDHLRAFQDLEVTSVDYEEAASFYNRCRENGVQGSNTDFLICAVAVHNNLAIFTTDVDFVHFGKVLPISLHSPT